MKQIERTNFVGEGGAYVFKKDLNIVFEGKMYTEAAIKKQIAYDIKRGFLKDGQELDINSVGEQQDFLDDNNKLRFRVENTREGIFKIMETSNPTDLYNPRNNPTPIGAENQDFGRGFAALGGNSYPKAS